MLSPVDPRPVHTVEMDTLVLVEAWANEVVEDLSKAVLEARVVEETLARTEAVVALVGLPEEEVLVKSRTHDRPYPSSRHPKTSISPITPKIDGVPYLVAPGLRPLLRDQGPMYSTSSPHLEFRLSFSPQKFSNCISMELQQYQERASLGMSNPANVRPDIYCAASGVWHVHKTETKCPLVRIEHI